MCFAFDYTNAFVTYEVSLAFSPPLQVVWFKRKYVSVQIVRIFCLRTEKPILKTEK